MVPELNGRKRRPHNVYRIAMVEYLLTKPDRTASTTELREATKNYPGIGEDAPQSSYRQNLQDERYFTRISRGVFRLNGNVTDNK